MHAIPCAIRYALLTGALACIPAARAQQTGTHPLDPLCATAFPKRSV